MSKMGGTTLISSRVGVLDVIEIFKGGIVFIEDNRLESESLRRWKSIGV
jgi:hypothetical protein